MIILWIVFVVLLLFAVVSFFGAPYVPTHAASIKLALDMLPLKKGATVVDLGSGDGAFLKAAAERGYRAVGYEINPILWLVSWLRCLQVRKLVSIKLRNFWLVPLPKTTDAVFVFAAGPYMKRLKSYLDKSLHGRDKPLIVMSYGFSLPDVQASRVDRGINYYELPPKR